VVSTMPPSGADPSALVTHFPTSFVIDTNKESIAIAEARKLGIPVAAILDSNSNPDGITYPIPGNDDASRAIAVYCDIVARAIIDGLSESQLAAGVDVGESDVVLENLSAPTPEPPPQPDAAPAPEPATEA
ncbi:MAG: 30S ribosomal protein S2, partial [Alphaproteobacteria bacterium]